jgi:hypothetical protein
MGARHGARVGIAVAAWVALVTGGVRAAEETLDPIAEAYVRLALEFGTHDPAYVDAWYGPDEWRTAAERTPRDLAAIRAAASAELVRLAGRPEPGEELDRLRHTYLEGQLRALAARTEMLEGRRFTFDEESRALYDAEAPHLEAAHFQKVLDRLATRLPGEGPLADRWESFRRDFLIAPERLDAVFTAAIEEARRRTAAHVELPEGESFRVEYVSDQPWSGYNWYQGGFQSLIQVNTDLPIAIDRAIDLACHEGYPGHHVYNVLLERHLVRERGFTEFFVYPLFSPQSLIAEGTANFGVEVAFPGDERLAFERQVLYPLAGLDPGRAAEYAEVLELVEGLAYADNEAARRYLDGEWDADATRAWLERYSLVSPERARQRLRFFDSYRSYVINYNLGQDLVRDFVERRGGTADQPVRRWAVFQELLASPRLPAGLR